MQKSGILAIVLIILLGAAAAAPYWFGMQAEEAYNKALQEITRDGQVVITRQTYERGWLDSTAEATYSFGGMPVSLTVTNKIYHGPIPMEGEVRWSQPSSKKGCFDTGLRIATVDGKTVSDTIYTDETYHITWSAVLESVFGNFRKFAQNQKNPQKPFKS